MSIRGDLYQLYSHAVYYGRFVEQIEMVAIVEGLVVQDGLALESGARQGHKPVVLAVGLLVPFPDITCDDLSELVVRKPEEMVFIQ
jgi:hypothetical protein